MAFLSRAESRRRKESNGASAKKKTVKQLPSLERLQQLFVYDSQTGSLTRRVSTSANARQGDRVGSRHNAGYLQMQLDGKKYLVHRIIWKLVTGKDPEELEVDHKNGVGQTIVGKTSGWRPCHSNAATELSKVTFDIQMGLWFYSSISTMVYTKQKKRHSLFIDA